MGDRQTVFQRHAVRVGGVPAVFRCDDPEGQWIADMKGGQVNETGTEIVVRPDQAQVGLFGSDDPDAILAKASHVAGLLKDVAAKGGLVKKISGRDYMMVDGLATLGALVNVFAEVEWTRPVGDDADHIAAGWEAAVIVTRNGEKIGRAEAQCLRSETTWAARDDFTLRSMAQTRATGKALRMVLGWIAVLAGYEATPAEEMPAQAYDSGALPFDPGPAQDPPKAGAPSVKAETGGASTIDGRQVKLLWATIRKRGVPDEAVRRILLEATGQESTKAIPQTAFDGVLKAIQAVPVESPFKVPTKGGEN